MRITDELLDLLGNEYEEMIKKTGKEPEDAPFYLMVERYLYLKKTSNLGPITCFNESRRLF